MRQSNNSVCLSLQKLVLPTDSVTHLIPIKVCLRVNILKLKIWESKTVSKSHLRFFFMDMLKI